MVLGVGAKNLPGPCSTNHLKHQNKTLDYHSQCKVLLVSHISGTSKIVGEIFTLCHDEFTCNDPEQS